MQKKFEKLIKVVYKKWKQDAPEVHLVHPDEEMLTCFLEGRLTEEESDVIREHIISCDTCAEAVSLQLQLAGVHEQAVPAELLTRVKNLVAVQDKASLLEITLKLKEEVLEILHTTGDILLGQEFLPAPVLRSRQIKDFKDEITVLKDFKDIRVELKIENKAGKKFNVNVSVKRKETQEIIKDLRITLIKDDVELESYVNDTGLVTFEHILAGKYTVKISNVETAIASILLDVRV